MLHFPGIAFAITAVAAAVLSCQSPLRANPAGARDGVPSSSPASARQPGTCKAWIARLLEEHEKDQTRRQTRDQTVRSLATSCAAIPEVVRVAAAQSNVAKTDSDKSRILARAVTAVLGAGCAVDEPLSDARRLAKACPLPGGLRFSVDDSMLMDLRALDYAILLVLLKGLQRAGEFTEDAERMILNFALSAQIFGEDVRHREGARHPRRP